MGGQALCVEVRGTAVVFLTPKSRLGARRGKGPAQTTSTRTPGPWISYLLPHLAGVALLTAPEASSWISLEMQAQEAPTSLATLRVHWLTRSPGDPGARHLVLT